MFSLVIPIVLFAFHWLVYDFFVRAFAVKNKKTKLKIRLTLLLLFLSFVFSFILLRWQENLFTQILNFSFGLWMGMLVNLVSIIILAWIIVGIIRIFGKKINLKLVAKFVILIVFFCSSFGVWNAVVPQIKNVEVSIKNLPPEWQGKTIVQITDLHLGSVLGESFLNRVVSEINKIDAEIVVITGDLLDGNTDGVSSFINLLDEIKTKKGVYFVTGNHENYRGIEDSLAILGETEVNILDDEIVDLDGLQLIGISYPNFGEVKNIQEIIQNNKNFNPDQPNVLLYHPPVSVELKKEEDANLHQNLYWSPNTNFRANEELGIDLQLSGHTHRGQMFPFTLLAKWIFNGYEYGLYEEGDFSIYVSSGTGVWGPTMRIGTQSEIVAIKLLKKE